MPQKKNRDDPQVRAIEIDSSLIRVNEENRTIELPVSSEYEGQRWWGKEILGHGPNELDLERIRTVGSFLFAHGFDPNYGKMPIGPIQEVWVDDGEKRCWARLGFDTDEKSETLWQKVKSGSLRGVSVRYKVFEWLDIEEGHTEARGITGPASIATKWELREISLEPVPFDPTVGVGRSDDNTESQNQNERNDIHVGEENRTNQTPNLNPEPQVRTVEPEKTRTIDENKVREEAIRAERARVSEITEMCRSFDIDPAGYVDSGRSIDEVRADVLKKLQEKKQPTQTRGLIVGAGEMDKIRAAISDGLSMRAGCSIDKPADGANEFRGMRLLEVAREIAERSTGRRIRDDEEAIRSALGTSDFPAIMSNVANNTLLAGYNDVPTTFEMITSEGNLSDFKQAQLTRFSGSDDLLKMDESGEFKTAEFADEAVYVSLDTYGRAFTLNRRAIINDALGSLTDTTRYWGRRAKQKVNKTVYGFIKDNSKIYDGKTLFHADHKNLAAQGGVIGKDSLSAARVAMRRQTGIKDNDDIVVVPKYLLVPPELETDANIFIGSEADPEGSNSGVRNPFKNSLVVLPENQLTDAKAWFLISDPRLAEVIRVSYLNGRKMPMIESQVMFDILGIKYRVYFDFGVNVVDFRGIYKNPGA